MRLSLETIGAAPTSVVRPGYDLSELKPGIVHLGVGAFHRAHQAVFTDDAIAAAGGDWGIVGVSMRKPEVQEALAPQDGLFTVEILGERPLYRIVGALRGLLTLPRQPADVIAAIASSHTQIVTLTITEKGYNLGASGLNFGDPEIIHDLADLAAPKTAIGVLVAGLAARWRSGRLPLTVISCDNLSDNGRQLGDAVLTFAERIDPALASWARDNVSFPETMVDSIVPASDKVSRERVNKALGLIDEGSVQREEFTQWVIEDRFVTPRPAWGAVGVEVVRSVGSYRKLKLYVLNAAHSCLAYCGLPRGHTFVREAIADRELAGFVDEMVMQEVAPALSGLDVEAYWRQVLRRFANPMIDHRLDQIALDGAYKLEQRIWPVVVENRRAGRSATRLASVVRAWQAFERGRGAEAPFAPVTTGREEVALRAAVLEALGEANSH